MILCDTHIHTTYCDGKSTVDEIIAKAGEMGITSLGFSGHGYTDFDASYCMSKEDTEKYIEDILRAKKSAPFEVYLGIEKDILSDLDFPEDFFLQLCVQFPVKFGFRRQSFQLRYSFSQTFDFPVDIENRVKLLFGHRITSFYLFLTETNIPGTAS